MVAIQTQLTPRQRLPYVPLLFIIPLFALSLRFSTKHFHSLPIGYINDTLWALLVLLLTVFISPRLSLSKAMLFALGFAYLTEVSQLYHADWIDEWRATTLGALIFGSAFDWIDLLCYTVGIMAGGLIDILITRHRSTFISNN